LTAVRPVPTMAMKREGSLFELSEKVVEQIVFAMEDQEREFVIDLESGEALPAEGHSGEGYVRPPVWSSREGFKLMEDFLASVHQPSARDALSAALARGRGVFKAFKAVLAERQDLERAFRGFKFRAMHRTIAIWYDDIREARGLERLGPEPEDTDELVLTDLDIGIIDLKEAKKYLLPLLEESEEEGMDSLPSHLVAFELERVRNEIAASEDGLCAIAYDDEGGALGAALGFRTIVGERGFGRIVFLMVKKEFRRMGLGRTLLESLTKAFFREGMPLVALDSALLPSDFGSGLVSLGYKPYGLRLMSRGE
jgi:ribosomal protein S18 acetylase RimI-like enzyme